MPLDAWESDNIFMRHNRIKCLTLALLLCLSGCGGGGGETEGQSTVHAASGSEKTESTKTHYQIPEFADSAFHADKATGDDKAQIDLSAVASGYVAVSAKADSRLKFQVIKGEDTYTYNVANDGTPSIFPVQCGDGVYTFRVMVNTTETNYAVMYTTDQEVKLTDEFQPFLRPSDYVSYSKTSECVKKAGELAEEAEDAVAFVAAVFEYICDSVTYDREKASTVQNNKSYLPDPDETLRTGKGICFDYAALAAAMLRSQGIPTKMVFGNVSPDNLYHAWNMFYTEETGWVTVDYEVKSGDWNRLDLTFSANGADGTFIGDGGNYADVYYY